ncbi:MAG: hypothetical protein ABIH29_05435 [Candidatus Micrarchaeota archaeon]
MTSSQKRILSPASAMQNGSSSPNSGRKIYSPGLTSCRKPHGRIEGARVLQHGRERATFWEANKLISEIRRMGEPDESDEEFYAAIGVPASTRHWFYDMEPIDRVGISLVSLRMASLLARDRTLLPPRLRDSFSTIGAVWAGESLVVYPRPGRELPQMLAWGDQNGMNRYSVDTQGFLGKSGIALLIKDYVRREYDMGSSFLHLIIPNFQSIEVIEDFPQTSGLFHIKDDNSPFGEKGSVIDLYRNNRGAGISPIVRDLREPPDIVYVDVPPNEELDVVVELPDATESGGDFAKGVLQYLKAIEAERELMAAFEPPKPETPAPKEIEPEHGPEFSQNDVRKVVRAAVSLVCPPASSTLGSEGTLQIITGSRLHEAFRHPAELASAAGGEEALKHQIRTSLGMALNQRAGTTVQLFGDTFSVLCHALGLDKKK